MKARRRPPADVRESVRLARLVTAGELAAARALADQVLRRQAERAQAMRAKGTPP